MSSTPKSKKPKVKPTKSRPASTSAVAQLTVEDSPSQFTLSSFSPKGELFAFVSLAVDKHRLRVYDTTTNQSIAEYSVDSGRVTSIAWTTSDSSEEDEGHRKKRKRRQSQLESSSSSLPQCVVLGLSTGQVHLFSSSQAKVIRTLSHPTSTSAIQSISVPSEDASELWTSGADGSLRLWNFQQSELVSTWKSEERIPYSSIALRPSSGDEDNSTELLAANHSISLLSAPSTSLDAQKTHKAATFTGHASAVKTLAWDTPSRFLSAAEGDRFVYVWDVPSLSDSSVVEGRVAASLPLDSEVRHVSLSHPSRASSIDSQTIVAVSASGKISVLPLPSEFSQSGKSKQTVSTLSPKSTISIASKGGTESSIVNASFLQGQDGKLRVARLASGVRLSFEVVEYLDATGDFISTILLASSTLGLGAAISTEGINGAPNNRYNESSTVSVRSGLELGQDASMDDIPTHSVDGELDTTLAELSLGQRLTALTGAPVDGTFQEPTSDEEDGPYPNSKSKAATEDISQPTVPASSLTRTLIQALHSSDNGLLETCLAHSNANLIQNTVRRLPPQLAVPLVTSCVERLGRGKRAGRGKGGGAGAGAQRGTALVKWIRAALIVHGGHLLTMPDLVARLSGLHQTLTTRLALQDSLLSLSGRLDMVISQIEMRSSAAPAPLPMPKKGKSKTKSQRKKAKQATARYVEGESTDDEEANEDGLMDVEVESADDAGSVEDVELGGSDEEEESDSEGSGDELEEDDDEEEDEDDGDDDEDSEGEGGKLNGFIDDEADEFSGDEDDDESE